MCCEKDLKPFIPPVSRGRVLRCYDGDTIHIAAKLDLPKSETYKFSVRLAGIDCPEMRSDDENEKATAIKARDELASMINGKIVELKDVSKEKYGRLLADVVLDGLSCSGYLVSKRLAVPYNGKTKTPPKDWAAFHAQG